MELTKILAYVPNEAPDGVLATRGEWLWAEPLGDGRYRVHSVPVHAYDLSPGDVVRCLERADAPRLILEVLERGGHRALRLIFSAEASDDDRARILGAIVLRDAWYEQNAGRLVSVDVPPEADLDGLIDDLASAQARGVLVFEFNVAPAEDDAAQATWPLPPARGEAPPGEE